ncbi:hypothetical protein L486_05064 [Kwoniella mangroviensis CBS 10435]|uniref:GH18 domain-containing protein n=1 Tax=Kwoniella mangroviensis CBS 10435 TaxID=1331196 RepID=A0A1B9IPV2_9TREE|nr:hypothetical protein L486_05064 [Kwoniella mangroviensis CBS 10435]
MDQIPIVGGLISQIQGQGEDRPPSPPVSSHGKRVVGYFTNWGANHFPPSMVPVNELTHLNYAFAKVNKETGEVTLSDPQTDTEKHFRPAEAVAGDVAPIESTEGGKNLYGCLGAFYLMKKHNRNLKIMLSVGGATYSAAFENIEFIHWRNTFAQTAVRLLEDCGLDGIDLDWEFPKNTKQGEYYAQLIKQIRYDLNALAQKNHQPKGQYLVSVAAPCGEDNIKLLSIREMDQNLDFWNLMAYDFAGSWSKVADHQANLHGTNPQDLSIDQAVKSYETHGVNSRKLVIGMPLYGLTFENTEGIGKPFNGSSTKIYKELPLPGAKVHNDTHIGASYSYDNHKRELISFDTPEIAKEKAKYINQRSLGGAMFWELAGDKPHNSSDSLVKVVHNNIGQLEKRQNELKYPNSKYDNLKGGMGGGH